MTAGLLVAGGSPQRLPAPFGPAANGSMFYHGDDGVIYAMDPATGLSTPVISGPEAYSFPLPSRDGQRILYDHKAGNASQLFVADADGANARPLAGIR